MEKKIQHKESRGLPGGPNEMFTYTTGVFSTEGFRMDSPDVNNYQNIIPSGSITMKERDGSPLRKGPIHGVDNLGNEQVMYPGYNYEFPGTEVTETLLAQTGYEVPKRRGVRLNYDDKGNVVSESTHIMATETDGKGNWFSFPTLFQNSIPYADDSKNWVDMSDRPWEEAYQEAKKRNEVIEFGKDKEAAIKFGEGSWKPKMKLGGALLDKTIKCGNCGWEWKAADGGSDIMDCHKCGGKGLVKAAEGGEPIVQTDSATIPTPTPATQYVVKKGDTLGKIAAANNTSIASIMRNNENIADPNVISVNQKINLATQSADAPKEEVYRDWDTIRNKKDEINKLSDEQKIIRYYNDKPEEKYLILDKKNAVMKLYTGGNFTKSYEVGVGQNPGDAQTVTKVKDGKTDWTGGNKSTGAGIYTISNIDPASKEYYGLPAFNLKNENGIEVATTIHGTPTSRRSKFSNGTVVDNRMSNGCINGKCEDLKDLYNELEMDAKVYILPEDTGNNFQIIDGKPALKVSAQNRQKYNSYVDQKGVTQKGQGANQTTKTLVYKPIKAFINEKKFKEDVFQWNDFNDEKEYTNTTKPFIVGLTTNKKDVMKAAKISSDVYNELAKMAFGIYGTESNFGDEHVAFGNLLRAGNKFLDPESSSSPDVKSKASTYGADENYRSVGYTQLRWNYLNKDEKAALKEVGITSNKDFLDPKKAAIGTVTVLGIRYNQQLTDKQKQEVWKYLPSKWNNRANYGSRVKSNSSYLSFKQLDKKQEGGEYILEAQKGKETEDTSWTAYLNPANWGTSRYDDAGTFKEAFRAARVEGDSDFLWKGDRYSTELKKNTAPAKPKGITPEILIRQAYRESAFNPKAVSPAGYKGLGQIGDDVIKDYKKANNIAGNVDPFNMKQNSEVQKYSMNELYNSSFINKPGQSEQVRLAKTLAAYNWGRTNVSNLLNDLKEDGVDIYNSLDWISKLPDEPKKYINDILLQKNTTFNTDFSKALGNQKNMPIKRLYGFRDGGESKPGPLMIAYNRLPAEKKMGGAIDYKQVGGEKKYSEQDGRLVVTTKKVDTADGPRYYQAKSPDYNFSRELVDTRSRTRVADSIPKANLDPRIIESLNKKQFGGQLNSTNITMYKDYIKGNIGNEEQAVKNYDKLNRIYYNKAKELGMTAANYIMTYVVDNS